MAELGKPVLREETRQCKLSIDEMMEKFLVDGKKERVEGSEVGIGTRVSSAAKCAGRF